MSSKLFMKLLEAVLKTGNRMNVGTARGGAMAFKLDTLLKLADVKGADGKTTLLHFVVQEMTRSQKSPTRAAEGTDISTGLATELTHGPSCEPLDELHTFPLHVLAPFTCRSKLCAMRHHCRALAPLSSSQPSR